MQHKFVAVSLAIVLVVLVAIVAAGQSGALAGLAQPLVINIDQAVPIDVTLALPQADGSVVTTTAPITVGVALRITIDGDQVVSVATSAGATATPAVALVRPTPEPAAPGDAPVYDSVRWQLEKAEDIGPSYDDPNDNSWAIETNGTLIEATFTVEVTGMDPTTILFGDSYGYEVMLQDETGRRFQPKYNGYREGCYYAELNPGLPSTCRIIFEVPTDATELSLVFIDDAGASAIALGF